MLNTYHWIRVLYIFLPIIDICDTKSIIVVFIKYTSKGFIMNDFGLTMSLQNHRIRFILKVVT